MDFISPLQEKSTLSPIAWALLELDEIGHAVIGEPVALVPLWRIDVGAVLTSKQVISFALEATAHASSRMSARPAAQA